MILEENHTSNASIEPSLELCGELVYSLAEVKHTEIFVDASLSCVVRELFRSITSLNVVEASLRKHTAQIACSHTTIKDMGLVRKA
jgi:hypothetical protein